MGWFGSRRLGDAFLLGHWGHFNVIVAGEAVREERFLSSKTSTQLVLTKFFSFLLSLFLSFPLGAASKWEIFKKILERTIKLFLLGLLIQGIRTHGWVLPFPYVDLDYFRVMGVLQRIAICYFVSGIAVLLCPPLPIEKDRDEFPTFKDVFLHVPIKYISLWAVGIAFTLGYAGLVFGLYVPDYREGSTWFVARVSSLSDTISDFCFFLSLL